MTEKTKQITGTALPFSIDESPKLIPWVKFVGMRFYRDAWSRIPPWRLQPKYLEAQKDQPENQAVLHAIRTFLCKFRLKKHFIVLNDLRIVRSHVDIQRNDKCTIHCGDSTFVV